MEGERSPQLIMTGSRNAASDLSVTDECDCHGSDWVTHCHAPMDDVHDCRRLPTYRLPPAHSPRPSVSSPWFVHSHAQAAVT